MQENLNPFHRPDQRPGKKISLRFFWLFLILVLVVGFALGSVLKIYRQEIKLEFPDLSPPAPSAQDLVPFQNSVEFAQYLQAGREQTVGTQYFDRQLAAPELLREAGELAMAPEAEKAASTPERISQTNVQVVGIDEPDVVKTDGQRIYFSREQWAWRTPPMAEFSAEIIPPPSPLSGLTQIIEAFPPENLASKSEIEEEGELLLADQTLIIFARENIYGYNVGDPATPSQKWSIEFEDNTALVAARLLNHKIYMVTQEVIDDYAPCPIAPFKHQGQEVRIECSEIYHPQKPVPVDVTFTVSIIDPPTGKVEQKTTLTGYSQDSVVYMSEDALYLTYSYLESIFNFFASFYQEQGQDLFPQDLIAKLAKVKQYDLSEAAKMVELQTLLDAHLASLSDDEKLRIENEVGNRLSDYYKLHIRDLEKSGMIRLKIKDRLEVAAVGLIPGTPLNQFALDEYAGHLRVATTVGRSQIAASGESANDVYVLNSKMEIVGAVQNLGLTERIYAARFIQDKGYIVTFRETDPFYVLDLTDPRAPALKGELKIPGYSSYLHPIDRNTIVGIGEEEGQVKVSLFDVSDPGAPTEKDKYILAEGWSEVNENHHAFLLDSKHQVFFLPGGQGGYIFTYQDDQLSLAKAVDESLVKRALYIDDYLYILSEQKVLVFDESNWQKVKEMEFPE